LDLAHAAFLAAIGFAGGIVTAIVGAASLLTFPALLAAGVPPVLASASNCVAMTPSNFVAALGRLSAAAAVQAGVPSRDRHRRVGKRRRRVAPDGDARLVVREARAPLDRHRHRAVCVLEQDSRVGCAPRRRPGRFTPSVPTGSGSCCLARWRVRRIFSAPGRASCCSPSSRSGRKSDFRTVNSAQEPAVGHDGVVAMIVFIAKGMVAWPPTLAC
jgi:hypothetical protein